MHIRPYETADRDGVVHLWREVFPDAPAHNVPENDIRMKLAVQPELFFVAVDDGAVIGSAMAGYDGHRGWVYYVAVKPDSRGLGVGTALMEHAERALRAVGCTKINVQVRERNRGVVDFYERLGYSVEPNVSMGKRLT